MQKEMKKMEKIKEKEDKIKSRQKKPSYYPQGLANIQTSHIPYANGHLNGHQPG